VLQLDETAFEPPPEITKDQADGFVRGVTSLANRLLLVIDVARVIGEEISHA
jgi:chemotaxis signal transduction protein